MGKQKYTAKEKKVSRMTRNGLVEENLATKETRKVTNSDQELPYKQKDLEEQKKQAEDMEYLKIIRSNGVSAEELQLMIDISKEEQKKILETREKEQTENEEIS